MLAIAVLSNAVNWWTAKTAREKDRQKIDAISKAASELKTTIETLGMKYLKLEKESRETDFALKTADLVIRAGEKAK
jgi:hypothetical protein